MTRYFIALLGSTCLIGASSAHAQAVALVGKSQTPDEAPKSFTGTPEGNWRTDVVGPDGLTREYVYVPPTRVTPLVAVSLGLREAGAPVVTYRYSISNGSDARQDLARFFLMAVHPVSARNVPDVWLAASTGVGLMFFGNIAGDRLTGVAPGEMVRDLIVEGPVLPGPIQAKAVGNPPRVPPPPGLTDAQREDLVKLSRPGSVDFVVIGPAIPIGAREPELEFDVVLSNIKMQYASELAKSGHPEASAVTAILDEIATPGAALNNPAVRQGLEKISALRADRLTTPWHRQLSEALSICAQALLSGRVPVRDYTP